MKILVTIIVSLFLSITNAQDIKEELKAINDVFPEILKREWPGNPAIEEMSLIPEDLKRELEITDSLKKCVNRLFICDTLKSLVKILNQDKWLFEDKRMSLLYNELIKSKGFENLVDYVFPKEMINNLWIYTQIDSIPQKFEESYLYVEFSRVCFNEDNNLGFFYISVLERGTTGYNTLVLVEKYKKKNLWSFVNATYFQ